ncbi:MAG: thioredoxin domain-containing protein [Bacilli bacterium]
MKIIRVSAVWCVSCIVSHKMWLELKEKYPDFEFLDYDYDLDLDQIEKYQIGTIIPVIIFLKNDNEILRITGEKNKTEFFKIIEEVIE